MKAFRISALAVPLLLVTAVPLCSQVCYQQKYANTIACLPTLTADAGTLNYEVYIDPVTNNVGLPILLGTERPTATPLGLGAQYAGQIATSPSAATSAGYIFTFQNGSLTSKPADLGPLVSDLPQTIGRHRMYVGASYQWMQFTKIGGKDIRSFVFAQGYTDNYFAGVGGNGIEGWQENQASASLKVHSIDTYVSYGITDRLDVSVVIPWSHVAFRMNTSCLASNPGDYIVNGITNCLYFDTSLAQADDSQSPDFPWYEVLNFAPSSESLKSSGVGDLTVRGKYEFLKRERQGLALGLEVRMPTGDPLNLRGSGATGVRPFLAWSYNGLFSGRFSPHANVGFQHNGSSIDDVHDYVTWTGTEYVYSNKLTPSKIPNIFTSSVGADFALTRRINVDADVLERVFSNDGSQVFQNNVVISSNNTLSAPILFSGTSYKSTVIVGAKAKLADHFLFGANLMIDATPSTGMSYKPSPVATLSYDFGTTK